jgi:hypothetical protein
VAVADDTVQGLLALVVPVAVAPEVLRVPQQAMARQTLVPAVAVADLVVRAEMAAPVL